MGGRQEILNEFGDWEHYIIVASVYDANLRTDVDSWQKKKINTGPPTPKTPDARKNCSSNFLLYYASRLKDTIFLIKRNRQGQVIQAVVRMGLEELQYVSWDNRLVRSKNGTYCIRVQDKAWQLGVMDSLITLLLMTYFYP